jgi:hypothetical protein
VIGADVVLGLGQVHPGLPAVGRVHLRDQRRRHLHDRDAALVGRGTEAGQVADHASADGHEVVAAAHALRGQRPPDALGGAQRLVLLPRRHLDDAREAGDAPRVQGAHDGVGDGEPPRLLGERPRRPSERATTDPDGVLPRRRRGPEQDEARGDLTGRQRAQGGRGAAPRGPVAAEQDRAGRPLVGRGALAVQRPERRAIAGQRPIAPRGARPGRPLVDVHEDRDVPRQGRADPLGPQRPAAERDHPAVGALEQLAGDLLLARPERRLALAVEHVGDRLAQLLLEEPVRVLGLLAQSRGDLVGDGRLAGAHEADEDQGPPQRRHPIRCR